MLFGRSIGEAVLIRIASEYWVAIDSMLAQREAVSLRYLRTRGIDPSHIRVVVATHWHTDHVLGLDQIVSAAPDARFMYPDVHSRAQLRQLAAAGEKLASWEQPAPGQGFAAILRALVRRPAKPISSSMTIAERGSVRLLALSPTDHAVASGLTALGTELAGTVRGRSARIPRPNATSIAAFLVAGQHCAVLGADLVDHPTYGWDQAIRETTGQRGKVRSRLLKVPHHGSQGADAASIWSCLMECASHGAISPYRPSGLPRASDLDRLRNNGCTPHVASHTGPSSATADWLAAVGPDVTVIDPGDTAVLHFRPDNAGWQVVRELL